MSRSIPEMMTDTKPDDVYWWCVHVDGRWTSGALRVEETS